MCAQAKLKDAKSGAKLAEIISYRVDFWMSTSQYSKPIALLGISHTLTVLPRGCVLPSVLR